MAKKIKKTAKKKASATKTVTKKPAVKKAKKAAAKKTAVKKPAQRKIGKKTVVKTVKKASSSVLNRKVRRRRKTTLSKAEVSHFHELLIEKLKEIMGDVDHIESEALKKSRLDASGDLSSMPIHMADIGSDNYEQEFSLGLMDSERKIVQEIHAALKRIEEGTYGICEGTGEPIPKARLEGIPWTPYCVKYAEMIEKGLASEENHWYDYANDADENIDEDVDEELDEDEAERQAIFYGYDDEDDDEELV